MKLAIALLMFFFMPEEVTVSSAITNQNNVLVVELRGRSSTNYTIACNANEDTCKVPDKGTRYFLGDTGNELYTCHNVALYLNGKQFGLYCLRGEN